jgi:hypothetical protein
MNTSNFEVRQRPKGNENNRTGVTAAIRETLTSGAAVFIPCNGDDPSVLMTRMGGFRSHFKNEGLRVRCRSGEGGIYLWVEPRSVTKE